MQIYCKECKSCRIRLFGKFFLEEVIVVTMHIQDNSSRARNRRHSARRTSEGVFHQCRMENLVVRIHLYRINRIRRAQFRVYSLLWQRIINDGLQCCRRERFTVSLIPLLFFAGSKASISGCGRKKCDHGRGNECFCPIHANTIKNRTS